MPLMKEPSRLLESVVAIAKDAGEAILAIYGSDFTVVKKSDKSPLTLADLAAHKHIVSGLGQLNPKYPVLSEEAMDIAYEERKEWTLFWLVDPLDGTKEFVKRNGEFTVNIALIHEHVPVLGVVHAPALGLTYFAAESCGAFRQQGTETPRPIWVRSRAPEHPIVVGSRSHRNAEMEAYLDRMGNCELRPMGSSLKLCLVAEGSADLYPRIGPTSEWDTAAAHCVVTEAGGTIVDLQGEPLVYNTRPSLLNPYFVVFGDKSRRWLEYAEGIEA